MNHAQQIERLIDDANLALEAQDPKVATWLTEQLIETYKHMGLLGVRVEVMGKTKVRIDGPNKIRVLEADGLEWVLGNSRSPGGAISGAGPIAPLLLDV